MTSDTREEAPFVKHAENVDCPYCDAPEGEHCRWPAGMEHMVPNPHWARRSAAHAPEMLEQAVERDREAQKRFGAWKTLKTSQVLRQARADRQSGIEMPLKGYPTPLPDGSIVPSWQDVAERWQRAYEDEHAKVERVREAINNPGRDVHDGSEHVAKIQAALEGPA